MMMSWSQTSFTHWHHASFVIVVIRASYRTMSHILHVMAIIWYLETFSSWFLGQGMVRLEPQKQAWLLCNCQRRQLWQLYVEEREPLYHDKLSFLQKIYFRLFYLIFGSSFMIWWYPCKVRLKHFHVWFGLNRCNMRRHDSEKQF